MTPATRATAATTASAATTAYARRLGLFSGTLLVVAGIIGSGIFLNPAVVAQRVGSGSLSMLAWGLGAVIAILGAFIFAELGARAPAAGGGYAYLRDAFGPLPAFLYGWALITAIASGAIAAVAVTFANYAVPLIGLAAGSERPLAIGAILFFSVVNVLGITPGAVVTNVFTLLKLAAIAVLVIAGAGLLGASGVAALPEGAAALVPPQGAFGFAVAIGTALVPVLFAYGGWQQTNFVAEEMRDPRRDLPRALIIGVLIVAAAYLLVNYAYLSALGAQGLAASKAPAADAMALRFGENGRRLIAAGIAISTAGFIHVVILANSRVYQAMARDGVFFRALATLHPRTQAPVNAILLQTAVAIGLLLTGGYGDLLDWVTFADWIFFGLCAATLIVYRRRAPRADHFLAPLHPWSTGLFLLAAAYVVLGAIVSNPMNALRGTLVLAAGVPAYLWWRRGGAPG